MRGQIFRRRFDWFEMKQFWPCVAIMTRRCHDFAFPSKKLFNIFLGDFRLSTLAFYLDRDIRPTISAPMKLFRFGTASDERLALQCRWNSASNHHVIFQWLAGASFKFALNLLKIRLKTAARFIQNNHKIYSRFILVLLRFYS
jgi:hypothetical protein